MRVRRAALGPIALGIVLAAALLVGSGAFDSSTPGPAARIASLERIVKCPGCDDLSVAQSNAPSSIAVRREIAADVRQGRTNAEILSALTATYGGSVLLDPPAGAWGTALWLAPVVLACVFLAVAVAALRRRRRAP